MSSWVCGKNRTLSRRIRPVRLLLRPLSRFANLNFHDAFVLLNTPKWVDCHSTRIAEAAP